MQRLPFHARLIPHNQIFGAKLREDFSFFLVIGRIDEKSEYKRAWAGSIRGIYRVQSRYGLGIQVFFVMPP